MPYRVFISHSTKNEVAKQWLCAIAERLENESLRVLLDRKLLIGDDWAHRLHTWIGICHAAVILFSPQSTDSDWVLKEATLLQWRQSLDPRFLLLPVTMPGVEQQDIAQAKGFSTLQLSQTQFLAANDAEMAADAIIDKLRPAIRKASNTEKEFPLIPARRGIQRLLEGVSTNTIEAALDEVVTEDAQSQVFLDRDNQKLLLAEELLHAEPAAFEGAFTVLCDELSQDQAKRILEIVEPCWIPIEFVEAVTLLIQHGDYAAWAINANKRRIGMLCVKRCSGRLLLHEIDNTAAVDPVGRILNEIKAADGGWDLTNAQCISRLKSKANKGHPEFVVLGPDVPAEARAEIRQELPFVPVLAVLGNPLPRPIARGIDEPELNENPGFEDGFEDQLMCRAQDARDIIRQKG